MLTTKFLNGTTKVELAIVTTVNCNILKEFESNMKNLMNKTERLIMDIEEVRFIETYGFEALNKPENRSIFIRNASEDIRELYHLMKLDQEFQFSEN